MKIVAYSDTKTSKKLINGMEVSALILDSRITSQWGQVITTAENLGLFVTDLKSVVLKGDGSISLIALFRGDSCQRHIQSIDVNGVQTITNENEVSSLREDFFSSNTGTTATLDSCSLLFVKPSLVKQQSVGAVIQKLLDTGYELSAILSVALDRATATEFLAKYEGVYTESLDLHILEFSGGVGIAIEVRSENAVPNLRKTCGPWDVDMARELFPESLRGKYGVDNVRDGVYCCDLEGSGGEECRYFFEVL